jgi:hypothetical protein
MVTVTNYSKQQSKDGSSFIKLELQGDLIMAQSQQTGKFYATAKRCSITSTFTEDQAKHLIGNELPGRIEKLDCESYEYTVPETGEVVTISHRYEYLPEGVPTPMTVVHMAEAV